MSSLALPITMKSFQRLLSSVSADVTVCVRGRHAIGKSEGVYQGAALRVNDFYKDPANCAKMVSRLGGQVSYKKAKNMIGEWKHELGLPVIERRLSQMTEGDIIGLPEMQGDHKATTFRPCDWLIQACEFPVLLFLDERNRALEGVKQAVFQLADSKIFYGHHLHPDTIIVIAENIGDAYTVNQSDPAETSRAATVELDPSRKEWIDYISEFANPAMVEFLRTNERCIEHTEVYEANKKYPDRRSWVNLDAQLTELKLYDNPEDQLFYVLTGAFCGIEVAGLFKKFCAERDRNVSAIQILTDWDKAKTRLGRISSDMYVELVAKLQDWLKKNTLNPDQAVEVARFMYDAPGEPRMSLWAALSLNIQNATRVHKWVDNLMVTTGTGQSGLKKREDLPAPGSFGSKKAEEHESEKEESPTGRKRGARR